MSTLAISGNTKLSVDAYAAGLHLSRSMGLPSVVYTPGSPLFRKGEPGGCAYLIESGHVEVSHADNGVRRVLARLGPGDVVGEMAALDSQPRSADAVAIEPVEVIPIPGHSLKNALDEADPLVQLLLRELLHRLRASQGGDVPPASESELRQSEAEVSRLRERAVSKVKTQRSLADALARREFELHYQPIVALSDGRTAGFEALIRWLSPQRGMVAPGEFIGVAESSGLILPIGQWALEQACYASERLHKLYRTLYPDADPPFMCVNLSPRQLQSSADADALIGIINATGVDPNNLKLEITEQILVHNPDAAAAAIRKFRKLGAQVAIDDFGTGYSSLSYLHRFDFDVIKLDRSFVNGADTDSSKLRIVRAVVGMANELGMQVVGEGVETVEQFKRLKALNFDFLQGYLFARPMPLEGIERLLGEGVCQRISA